MGCGAAWSPSLWGGSVYRQGTAVSQDRDRASGEVFQEGSRKALAAAQSRRLGGGRVPSGKRIRSRTVGSSPKVLCGCQRRRSPCLEILLKWLRKELSVCAGIRRASGRTGRAD